MNPSKAPRRRRTWLVAIATLCLISTLSLRSDALLLRDGIGAVILDDGRTIEGEITEREADVVVKARGVTTTLPRERIVRIDYGTFAERFEQMIASLATDDFSGHIALSRLAYDRREYELALRAVNAALLIDAANLEARDLEKAIQRQITLEANRPAPAPSQPNPPATDPANPDAITETAPATPNRPARTELLTDEHINRIRFLELKKSDRVRINFQGNVRQDYVKTQTRLTYRDFAQKPEVEQALDIFNSGDDKLISRVRIMSDPPALETYLRRVGPAIVQGCATSKCHGDPKAAFRLVSPVNSREAHYTNFFILSQYAAQAKAQPSDNIFAAQSIGMIERGAGSRSLLAGYALPRDRSANPHPEVRGFTPIARAESDPLYQTIVRWMDEELQQIKPDYAISFSLPQGAETAPTDAPTAEPGTETAPDPNNPSQNPSPDPSPSPSPSPSPNEQAPADAPPDTPAAPPGM